MKSLKDCVNSACLNNNDMVNTNNINDNLQTLYNIQFTILETNIKMNLFVFANNKYNAQEIVMKQYSSVTLVNMYCQKVDIYNGLIIRA